MGALAEWWREHKLTAIGSVWATGVAGSLAYNWSRPLPTQLKVIHSRVYAQAITWGPVRGVRCGGPLRARPGAPDGRQGPRLRGARERSLRAAAVFGPLKRIPLAFTASPFNSFHAEGVVF